VAVGGVEVPVGSGGPDGSVGVGVGVSVEPAVPDVSVGVGVGESVAPSDELDVLDVADESDGVEPLVGAGSVGLELAVEVAVGVSSARAGAPTATDRSSPAAAAMAAPRRLLCRPRTLRTALSESPRYCLHANLRSAQVPRNGNRETPWHS
jgi:hypothetical protein